MFSRKTLNIDAANRKFRGVFIHITEFIFIKISTRKFYIIIGRIREFKILWIKSLISN